MLSKLCCIEFAISELFGYSVARSQFLVEQHPYTMCTLDCKL